MDQAWRAADLAHRFLSTSLPRRWSHSQGVAERARDLSPVPWIDVDTMEAAGWLHDLGYAPELALTGFHPLDGARFLREQGEFSPLVQTLVARHSCAGIEAAERGLQEQLDAEFPAPEGVTARLVSAITWCDMTTSPSGERMAVEDRLKEILVRYAPGDTVYRAISQADPYIRQQCAETEAALQEALSAQSS